MDAAQIHEDRVVWKETERCIEDVEDFFGPSGLSMRSGVEMEESSLSLVQEFNVTGWQA